MTAPAATPDRTRWRPSPLALLGVCALAIVVYGYRRDLPATGAALSGSAPGWLAALVALALFGALAVGNLFRSGLIAAGVDVGRREGAALGLTAYALNLVIKSSGMAGLAPVLRWAAARGHARGPVVGGYVVATLLNHLAFAIVLLLALVVVALGGRFTALDAGASAVFAVYLGGHAFATWAVLRRPDVLRWAYALPQRALAKVRRRPSKSGTETLQAEADDLRTALVLARTRPRAVASAAAWALAVDVVHVLWLWAALRAVGAPAGLDAALVAYGLATLFGIVGFLPAGLGFVELGMTATLSSFGVTVAEAAAAVLLFRLAELWLPLALGAAAARFTRRQAA